jgi:hypothetical protein
MPAEHACTRAIAPQSGERLCEQPARVVLRAVTFTDAHDTLSKTSVHFLTT